MFFSYHETRYSIVNGDTIQSYNQYNNNETNICENRLSQTLYTSIKQILIVYSTHGSRCYCRLQNHSTVTRVVTFEIPVWCSADLRIRKLKFVVKKSRAPGSVFLCYSQNM